MTTANSTPVGQQATRRTQGPHVGRSVMNGVKAVVTEMGQMVQLLCRVIYTAVRKPVGYWADTRDEMFLIIRQAAGPAAISVALFVLLVATFAVALLAGLGAPNRLGYVFVPINTREIAGFMTGLATAGIIGTSITADLGARKIREELDALTVLGMDPIRMLVLPKVIATGVILAMLNVLSLLIGLLVSLFAAVEFKDVSMGAYLDSMKSGITAPEIWGAEVKTFLMGVAIAIVCSHKGLRASGGPEGLGRAVNQAVVVSFIGVMLINVTANSILQGLYPQMNTLR